MRILLVDDDPEIRLVARFALGRSGHTVAEAPDTETALALGAEAVPDLIVMDVVLGTEDGVSAAERLRASIGPVPVVFLTGKSRPEDLDRLDIEGALGVVGKPFDPMTLDDTIARLMAAG